MLTPRHPSPDPFKPFIIFSNRHEIRRIDLQKGDYSVLVPGLRNTIALDFHLSQSALYWTDVVEDKIYRGKLLDNGGGGSPRGPGCWPPAEALRSPTPHALVNWLDFAVGLSA